MYWYLVKIDKRGHKKFSQQERVREVGVNKVKHVSLMFDLFEGLMCWYTHTFLKIKETLPNISFKIFFFKDHLLQSISGRIHLEKFSRGLAHTILRALWPLKKNLLQEGIDIKIVCTLIMIYTSGLSVMKLCAANVTKGYLMGKEDSLS